MPNERKLRELIALSQIYNNQQGNQDAVQARKMQAALSLLGMQQQQQQQAQQQHSQQADLDLRRQQLAQQGDQFNRTEANRSGEYWQGTYPLQQQSADLQQRNFTQDEAFRQKQLAQSASQFDRTEANRSGEYWQGTYPLHQQQLADEAAARTTAQKGSDSQRLLAAAELLSQQGLNPGVAATLKTEFPQFATGDAQVAEQAKATRMAEAQKQLTATAGTPAEKQVRAAFGDVLPPGTATPVPQGNAIRAAGLTGPSVLEQNVSDLGRSVGAAGDTIGEFGPFGFVKHQIAEPIGAWAKYLADYYKWAKATPATQP